MIIQFSELVLHTTKIIEINGEEPFLAAVYDEFFKRHGGSHQPEQRLKATLEFHKRDEAEVRVSGSVDFATGIECSTCQQLIFWHIKDEFRRIFKVGQNSEAVLDLSEADLEEEFIRTPEIDLAMFLAETLELAIPSQTVENCESCGNQDSEKGNRLVYASENNTQVVNPFHKLKDFGSH